MKAIELSSYGGLDSLKVVEVDVPKPSANEILIEVKATGINFAEAELTRGDYKIPKTPPFIMGFEAAGIVVELGSEVRNWQVGDKVTTIVSSGGYAEYATADAQAAVPISDAISFAEATTIPIQGVSAYCLLKFGAKLQPGETVMIQSAAGGVGLYLVQLAKIFGAGKIIALASSSEKLDLLRSVGADVAIDYSTPAWPDKVLEATGNRGVDIVFESSSGEVGRESRRLAAPLGRIIMFGAKNIHDTVPPEVVQQLIYKNQTLAGFNLPSLPRQQIAESIPHLLDLISQKKIRVFAQHSFPLTKVRDAFETFASRTTIGKVVLLPAE